MMRSNPLKRYITIIPFALLLALWELLVRTEFANPFFISSPSAILTSGFAALASGDMTPHIITSMGAVFIALLLALIIGVSLGILAGFYPKVGDVISPYLFTLNSLPIVAVTPLFILWFGFGMGAKILIIFLMAVIPVIIAAMDGAKSVDTNFITMARLYKASDSTILRSIVFYHAAPFIYSGMRVAVGRSFIGLVIAEIFGYNKGLGYLIALYSSNYQTALLMFTIIFLLACNVLLVKLITFLEKKTINWK
ncbi:MAG: ABC-type nitrate/sulfonate/bicarbonate transport system, permease component [Candidatus Wolfebacteria bacterium GW2011_GWC2_39_22]|uniref:ABC-type nitrate/sulfonate/bicarbonate transport system, permease component n=1 Tax=Candidatus Wolfebacteria bacterium GW2011_GWC2_39_22 TaxID=1619013 RepID=A0A0G0N8F1_9BACT|nr:MAG: ABC-type nitrate/sulfonate/bicarbonate transport system, permease component [Candidatus Wolfebacteria bacterium GW2011_GWC2_39_22]HBI25856.1 hypothetical protein [Candidatus Wolfebacteria bacterium]